MSEISLIRYVGDPETTGGRDVWTSDFRGSDWRNPSISWSPVLERSFVDSQLVGIHLGDPVVDEYLAFAGARLRLNSLLAVAFDLTVFFTIIGMEPSAVTTADVFAFIKTQRAPLLGPQVVRMDIDQMSVGRDNFEVVQQGRAPVETGLHDRNADSLEDADRRSSVVLVV